MEVSTPMPGTVLSIDVSEGQKVKANDEVATIEAMKMEVKIYAPKEGVIKEIKVGAGDNLNVNDVVMNIE
ncbi:MAG: acetyl-CoA carboxylase biotin carboxyl carrier protein subunit [Firmicutes bacterium]|nr:acetyl-CoA carboxylase biotin carboxyl carrier protein subunit [Bacillota bacterium]